MQTAIKNFKIPPIGQNCTIFHRSAGWCGIAQDCPVFRDVTIGYIGRIYQIAKEREELYGNVQKELRGL